jgi:hypothetical protein
MFRRRSRSEQDQPDAGDRADELAAGPADEPESASAAAGGPWDSQSAPEDGIDRVDLGSLRVAPGEGYEVRLQVDENTGEVQSVMLAGEEGALELRAFAAPRGGDLWEEIRPQIAADVSQHGGTATERRGRFGAELVCQMQVVLPDGSQMMQPSRIVGVNGARWLLRGTFLGQPAVEPDTAGDWEDAFASVVVHRGSHAMPAGDALPLTLPDDVQRLP